MTTRWQRNIRAVTDAVYSDLLQGNRIANSKLVVLAQFKLPIHAGTRHAFMG
jgi:hypothetical protein